MDYNDASDILSLAPYEFEKFVGDMLSQMGLKTTVTKASGDGGIDVKAEFETAILGGRFVVQCKRYSALNRVGVAAVRDLYGVVMHERASKGILITTSDFTAEAREFATGKPIELINGEALSTIIRGLRERESANVASARPAHDQAFDLLRCLATEARHGINEELERANHVRPYELNRLDWASYTNCVSAESQKLLVAIQNFGNALNLLFCVSTGQVNPTSDLSYYDDVIWEAIERATAASRVVASIDPPPGHGSLASEALRPFHRVLFAMQDSLRIAFVMAEKARSGIAIKHCSLPISNLPDLFTNYNQIVNSVNTNNATVQGVWTAAGVTCAAAVIGLAGVASGLDAFSRPKRRRRRW